MKTDYIQSFLRQDGQYEPVYKILSSKAPSDVLVSLKGLVSLKWLWDGDRGEVTCPPIFSFILPCGILDFPTLLIVPSPTRLQRVPLPYFQSCFSPRTIVPHTATYILLSLFLFTPCFCIYLILSVCSHFR